MHNLCNCIMHKFSFTLIVLGCPDQCLCGLWTVISLGHPFTLFYNVYIQCAYYIIIVVVNKVEINIYFPQLVVCLLGTEFIALMVAVSLCSYGCSYTYVLLLNNCFTLQCACLICVLVIHINEYFHFPFSTYISYLLRDCS